MLRPRSLSMRKPVIRWDGKNLPRGLEAVPPGEYELLPHQSQPSLSDEEERGIRAALRELDAGKGKSLSDVIREIRGRASGR
jgi:hypothetical protein